MIRRDDERDRDERFISRQITIERAKKDDKDVYRVSLSSETAIRDWPWAPENILEHNERAVDLSLAREVGLPLFVNHQVRDVRSLVGRIVGIKIEAKRLVGELKFSEANPDAAMIRGMVDEGTLTDMSITAEPLERKIIENEKREVETVRWTKWRPLEASVVGIGADRKVGIGREHSAGVFQNPKDANTVRSDAPATSTTRGLNQMDDNLTPEQKAEKEAQEKTAREERERNDRIERARVASDDNFAMEAEKRRAASIRALGKTNSISPDIVEQWVKRGYSLDQVADNLLSIMEERGKVNPQSASKLGLTEKETQQYSLTRAIVAAFDGEWKDAGFELECHKEIQQKLNRYPKKGGFFVPLEVQRRNLPTPMDHLVRAYPHIARDLTAGTAGAGGYLVQTSIASFDELLRNISFAFRMGVTRLSGLRDNVTIPRQSAAATAAWLANEASTITESQQTFVQLALSPKTVGAYTEVSRQLLLQSSLDIEGLVNADLAAVCALAVDAAVLNGSGAAGQPTGLDNTAGIGAVTGTSIAYAGILEFQTDVAAANVMPVRGGYVTTPAVAALLMQRTRFANTDTPLWDGNIWTGTVSGFPGMSTNQVAAATMYFGDWSKAVVGEWGVLEVDTNPFANFPAGIIGVRAMYSIDVGIRYPAAFSRAITIT